MIAVDQRGIGLSDKPQAGYDTGTLADDLVGLMDALGHERFAVVGHDTGFAIGYALAADYPERVERVALVELPGPPSVGRVTARLRSRVRSTTGCGTSRSTGSRSCPSNSSRAVRTSTSATSSPSRAACWPRRSIAYYVDLLRSDPDALRGSLGFYRAFDATLAQNDKRASEKLPMPVLAIGGAASYGDHVAQAMEAVANDVKGVIVLGAGHWVAEQAPDELLNALAEFLAPYRDGWSATQGAVAPAGQVVG